MSLNKIQTNGLIGQGLDIECKSINTSSAGSNLIRGVLTVDGISDFQGDVTCESSLTIVNNTTFFGRQIGFRPTTIFNVNAGGQTPITPSQLINGICSLESAFSDNIILPSSESIDILLSSPPNNATFHCSFINKSSSGEIIIKYAIGAPKYIPQPSSFNSASHTDIYFKKLSGNWTIVI